VLLVVGCTPQQPQTKQITQTQPDPLAELGDEFLIAPPCERLEDGTLVTIYEKMAWDLWKRDQKKQFQKMLADRRAKQQKEIDEAQDLFAEIAAEQEGIKNGSKNLPVNSQ
jgi:hypothetical protein